MSNSSGSTKTNETTASPSHSASMVTGGQGRAQITAPTYAAAFSCIGASCEAPCCGDWVIPLDKATYGRYQQFRPERLGSQVAQFVTITVPDRDEVVPDGLYARIAKGPSGCCPFFSDDHLCAIQKEYGPQLLSATCSIYPRSLSRVAGVMEGSLSLSCPEAARFVLLAPDSLQTEGDLFSGEFRTDNVFQLSVERRESGYRSHGAYVAIRNLLIEMVRDRSRPIWHRLLVVGSLCQRLDAIMPAEGEETLTAVLDEYRGMLETGTFPEHLEHMPGDTRLKLAVVFALSDRRVREDSGDRFRDVFWTFVEGIASSDEVAAGDDIANFLRAEEKYHRPFFARFPYILENYLVNYMFQNLFPYGRAGSADFIAQSMFDEYLQMTTQFAWINSLLIGIAGQSKEAISGEHVVRTIQSLTRAVEHYPEVLQSIREDIKSRGLDSLQGMAILLKN
jgi:lysine-N-methylase